MPASPGVMRPSGETAVASAMIRPAPPMAREPRCTRCQSPAIPSSEEYWHIGDTPMRLRSVTDLIVSESKRGAMESRIEGDRSEYANGEQCGGGSLPPPVCG